MARWGARNKFETGSNHAGFRAGCSDRGSVKMGNSTVTVATRCEPTRPVADPVRLLHGGSRSQRCRSRNGFVHSGARKPVGEPSMSVTSAIPTRKYLASFPDCLPTHRIVRYPYRHKEDRGVTPWQRIQRLLAVIEAEAGCEPVRPAGPAVSPFGVERDAKRRALPLREHAGLVTVDHPPDASPIVHLLYAPAGDSRRRRPAGQALGEDDGRS